MIQNIVAYIYSITGLIFFVAWQTNFSLTKYLLKEKNLKKAFYVDLFLACLLIFAYFLSPSSIFLLLLIIHFGNMITYLFMKDQIVDSMEVISSQLMEIITISFYLVAGFLVIVFK